MASGRASACPPSPNRPPWPRSRSTTSAGRTWLGEHQAADGSLTLDAGVVLNDSATAYAAIALGAGDARERALDHLEAGLAPDIRSTSDVPFDASKHGWAWTESTFGWVDPTARAVLALRLLRPGAPAIDDGVGMLRDRETVGGGWNYGNRVVLGEDLPPFAQTTAAALVALQDADPTLEERGLSTLKRLWRAERDGGLTVALATAALRLHGDDDADASERAVFDVFERSGFMDDVVALAWAAIATGPALVGLEVAR